ncbi:hypothetical protein V6N13_093206 [Hibiscus sabdariffa]|uniref:Uncharacterized protein n=1 Tax=Hibiscus sabdariffa TaxID=183260 RepID=A0ABR2CB02_9ROSI
MALGKDNVVESIHGELELDGGSREKGHDSALAGRLSTLVSDMNQAADGENRRLAQCRDACTMDNDPIEWHTNSTYEQPGESDMQV